MSFTLRWFLLIEKCRVSDGNSLLVYQGKDCAGEVKDVYLAHWFTYEEREAAERIAANLAVELGFAWRVMEHGFS